MDLEKTRYRTGDTIKIKTTEELIAGGCGPKNKASLSKADLTLQILRIDGVCYTGGNRHGETFRFYDSEIDHTSAPNRGLKVYVAGKITGLDNFKEIFAEAEARLQKQGHFVMNPAVLPKGFEQKEYMHICYAMIDVCDAIEFLPNWRDSAGACLEHAYALSKDKWVRYSL